MRYQYRKGWPLTASALLVWSAAAACASEDPSFTEARSSKQVSVAVESTRGSSADATAETSVASTQAVDDVWSHDTVTRADGPVDAPTGDTAGTDGTASTDGTAGTDGAAGTDGTLGDLSGSDGGTTPGSEELGDLPGSDGATPTDGGTNGGNNGNGNGNGQDGGSGTDGMTDGTTDGTVGGTDGTLGGSEASDGGSAEASDGGGSDGMAGGTTGGDAGCTDSCGEPEHPTDPDLAACAKKHGVPASRVKIAGNQPNVKIESDSVMAIKVTGNQPKVELSLFGADEHAKLAGLCIFMAGNQSKIDVFLAVDVGKVVYVGRGNKSEGDVEVQEGMTLDALDGDLAGNQAWLNLHGRGAHPCDAVRLRGHATRFTCE